MGSIAGAGVLERRRAVQKYDLLMLSCEGEETLANKDGTDPGARQSVYDYLNAGGRVFATHYHYVWFKDSPQQEFKDIATWVSGTAPQTPTR